MNNRLAENTSYIESADDFYGRQGMYLEKSSDFNKMGSLYNKRINQILSKDYEDISGQKAGDRLVKKVIRDKNKIQFGQYLKYLVDNGKINSNNNYDDVDQIGDLQDKLSGLKEQTENIGQRDFNISGGRIGKYTFDGRNNIEYIGNNKYIIKINFEKVRRGGSGILRYKITNNRDLVIGIKYDGGSLIKYYEGTSFNENDYLGKTIINHKEEYIEENRSSFKRKYGEKYKTNRQRTYSKESNTHSNRYQSHKKGYEKINRYSKTKSYVQGATEEVYLEELNMTLDLKFNN